MVGGGGKWWWMGCGGAVVLQCGRKGWVMVMVGRGVFAGVGARVSAGVSAE